MAEYFIALTKYYPRDSKPIFVGPFIRSEAYTELEKLKEFSDVELIKGKEINEVILEKLVVLDFLLGTDFIPANPKRSVIFDILTGTKARRTGGTNGFNVVGKDVTLALECLKLETEESVEAVQELALTAAGVGTYAPPVAVKDNNGKIFGKRARENEIEKLNAIIISEFLSNVEWLREHGIVGPQQRQAYPDAILGKSLVAKLPYRLATLAKRIGEIDMPRIIVSMKGKVLSLEDLYAAGARLRWYRVIEEEGDWLDLFTFLDDPDNWNQVMELVREAKKG